MADNNSSNGIGIVSALGIIFLVLKLTHVINWSWWLVLLPFWGGAALVITIILVVLAVALVAEFL